ncbi:MAG: nucleotidyltransferase family protein [Luminiphilus sp.]|nr:nucleotidyltransferase family protein [Luminiphilus sp.]
MTAEGCCKPKDCSSARLRIGGVLLAAGAGSRLGTRPKGLIEIDGEPLINRNLRLLRDAGADELVVVTGHFWEQLVPLIKGIPHKQVHQPGPVHAQVDSLRLGVNGLSPEIEAVLVLPVDMPALTRTDLIALVGAYKHARDGIEFVGPMVDGLPGNPVLFSRRIADRIARGEGAFGSGGWRHTRQAWLLEWQTDNTHYITDIDTPEDLAQWVN